jgi:hypothetical protein
MLWHEHKSQKVNTKSVGYGKGERTSKREVVQAKMFQQTGTTLTQQDETRESKAPIKGETKHHSETWKVHKVKSQTHDSITKAKVCQ